MNNLAAVPGQIQHLLHDVIRIQCRGMDHCLTLYSLLHELAVTLRVMLHERISVDHHGSGRYRAVTDLVPASCRHQRLNDADLLSHGTDQTLDILFF